jgi:hypothetical protein
MASPRYEILHKKIYNPGASHPLILPILVLSNTSDEDLERNIRLNSARDLSWVGLAEEHSGVAIMVGGGPSVADFIEQIRAMKMAGGTVFAMNGASSWLHRHGIVPDYQVIADAKEETATLVDLDAKAHLFASQVNAKTMEAVERPVIWQLGDEKIEEWFPAHRVKSGGYALIGGGASVGNSALCLVAVLGYRDIHAFGYDSSYRGEASHAYDQRMNRFIPTVEIEWAGKTYTASVAMKAQAEKFQMTAQSLKQMGCRITVYGDGLLQHMYTARPENLTERDKYRMMWQMDSYRMLSPGECVVSLFLSEVNPDGLIIDFGCGTGRAALALHRQGHDVYLIDFAGNCRDDEALELPFLEWDLTVPMPARAKYGICCDVMEHIPPQDVEGVIRNIMEAAETVFFQISTVPDGFGQLIGQPLHLSVHDHDWWLTLFEDFNLRIVNNIRSQDASIFIVTRKDAS